MSSRVVHVDRETGRVTVEHRIRNGRTCTAEVPGDLQPLELAAFLEQVRQVVTRRWRPAGALGRGSASGGG